MCKKKRHQCCEYCIKKYFEIHGNKCPIHPEHTNLKFQSSRYAKYHIESLKVKCPYSMSTGIHAGCSWIGTLKNLDQHVFEHSQFAFCPFAEYGCSAKLRIERECEDENDINIEAETLQTLEEHLVTNQHQHLVLLLKQTKKLSERLSAKDAIIDKLQQQNEANVQRLAYLSNCSRISGDNIWVLCGSHKFWKHKYNQLYTVNLRNECRTAIRIYDISRVSNNCNIHTTTPNGNVSANATNGSESSIYDPTQSDSWDVGDLGVAHVNNTFSLPVWLMKKYPNLDVFNRDRYNSIIFRCGGHLIRDKKV